MAIHCHVPECTATFPDWYEPFEPDASVGWSLLHYAPDTSEWYCPHHTPPAMRPRTVDPYRELRPWLDQCEDVARSVRRGT